MTLFSAPPDETSRSFFIALVVRYHISLLKEVIQRVLCCLFVSSCPVFSEQHCKVCALVSSFHVQFNLALQMNSSGDATSEVCLQLADGSLRSAKSDFR